MQKFSFKKIHSLDKLENIANKLKKNATGVLTKKSTEVIKMNSLYILLMITLIEEDTQKFFHLTITGLNRANPKKRVKVDEFTKHLIAECFFFHNTKIDTFSKDLTHHFFTKILSESEKAFLNGETL